MHKLIVMPGVIPGVGKLFVTIKWDGLLLSITGASGPSRDGNSKGSFGQCIDELAEVTVFGAGWDSEKCKRLADAWKRWNLNNMRAGSQIQEDWLRANPVSYKYPESHYDNACSALAEAGLNPDADGYRYGSKWKFEDVPADVIAELFALPISPFPHPWGY